MNPVFLLLERAELLPAVIFPRHIHRPKFDVNMSQYLKSSIPFRKLCLDH
jgi:hypothetical protein